MKKKPAFDPFSALLLSGCLIFYLFFGFFDGAIQWPDSATYIQMNIQREPLYPIYLAFFRAIADPSEEIYLQWAVIGQGILAAVCAWSLAMYLYKRLSLCKPMAVLLLCIPLGVSLLCRFAAGRQAMYSNGICSEALALPLFLLFIRYLYAYLSDAQKSSLAACCVLAFLMISIRKQMAISVVLILLVLFYETIHSRQFKKSFVRAAFCLVGIFAAVLLLDRAYNYCLRDRSVGHTGDGRFLTTMVLYTADRKDGEQIEDEIVREIFYGIYDACDAAGYLKNSAGKGWYARVEHFGDHYDHIQIDTLLPHVNAYVISQIPTGEVAQVLEMDRIMREMTNPLLSACLPAIITCFIDNFLSGLVTTIALKRPIFVLLSALLYLAYLAVWILLLCRKGRSLTTDFAFLTMASIIINVGLVSCVIFCQSRYTIYNMPLFYMSGLLMAKEVYGMLKQK